MSCARLLRLWLLAIMATFFVAPVVTAEVAIDWATVGDPGNDCDLAAPDCFGAVVDEYRIAKFEISNAQYTEFLNAVAVTDTHALFNPNTSSRHDGITRSGDPESFSYSAIAGRQNMPVIWVSLHDALRFANWLHNGQPTGAQDSTTTEDGAYDMSLGSNVVREASAAFFVPTEDEWYKAAYYKSGGASAGYWDYPAGSDTVMTCSVPSATPNTANCGVVNNGLTQVGSYTESASPNGTFDQGGNVLEWIQPIAVGELPLLRGAFFNSGPSDLSATGFRLVVEPTFESFAAGFRVASTVPAPVPSLGPFGIAILLGALGATAYRRLSESASVS